MWICIIPSKKNKIGEKMLKKIIDAINKKWSSSRKKNDNPIRNEENREKDHYHDKRDLKDYDFEFLIRRVINYEFSDDFEIVKQDCKEILTPNSLEFTDFRLLDYDDCEYKVFNSKVSITSEFVGIQITIENNGIERTVVKKILEDIRSNIEKHTHQTAQIFEI